jgi:Recombination endonuclease VII
MTEKLCPKCETVKDASAFYSSKSRPDGLSSYCKTCQIMDTKARYSPHPRWQAPEGQKWCPGCEDTKPLESFHANKGNYDGKANYCKQCAIARVISSRRKDPTSHRKASKSWAIKNKDHAADNHAKFMYGVEHGTYAAMFEQQGGVCAICGKPPKADRRLAIDHCHNTKQVRALLCSPCNTGIGQLQHDPELLLKAITYLRLHASCEGG